MPAASAIVTVGLNPAIDRVLEVEGFTIGAHQQGKEVFRMPAGKSLNVSRALALLGVHNTATGFLGKDNHEEFSLMLEELNIVDEFFLLPGRTRENVTITDPVTRQETHIRQRGLHVDELHRQRLQRKLQFLSRPDAIIVFSGSLPPGISSEEFAAMVDMCVAGGAKVAVDSSGSAIREVWARKLWLVKPNHQELSDLAGRPLDNEQQELVAARELADHIEVVLLTKGSAGALMFSGGMEFRGHVDLDESLVKNTVGCGDAMLAAFIAGVRQQLPIEKAFARAIACATASACTLSPADFDPAFAGELEQRLIEERIN